MEPDFSGWATKTGLKCTDGRTIMKDAFAHQDKMTVPLVWHHLGKEDPKNILGHAILHAREEGIYTEGFFNDTESGLAAKKLVHHKDITALSIWANKLVEKSKQVFHGVINEVSLVMAGANPGAKIDYVAIRHADGSEETLEDEAIIYTGLELIHGDGAADTKKTDDAKHAEGDEKTAQDVYDSLSDEQKELVHYMISQAIEEKAGSASHSDDEDDNLDKDDQEGKDMKHNVFDRTDEGSKKEGHVLTHDAMHSIFEDAQKRGSLNEAVEAYALKHGIENIEGLFPEPKDIDGGAPKWVTRRMEWVAGVINGVRKSPFSRIKTRTADLTMEEARAKGYTKGNFKKEQWFTHTQRTTGPTTVYKKQKLDRDDILDITDFDVVAWIKAEMRVMLEEEVARAILVGDGRDVGDEDKIKDPAGATDGLGVRSIVNENELYARQVYVELDDTDTTYNSYGVGLVEALLLEREFYRGTGQPTFYTTQRTLTRMLLARDQMGRRLYRSKQELATELQVADIVPVEVMQGQGDLVGILVNLADYNVGADRGGDATLFDDFDIDYNQYKYLIEQRFSGALTELFSAQVVRRRATTDNAVAVPAPTFDNDAGTVTIPTDANVDYFNADTGDPLADGSVQNVAEGTTLNVEARTTGANYPASGSQTYWSFYNGPAGA